jgi:hypothetical protein
VLESALTPACSTTKIRKVVASLTDLSRSEEAARMLINPVDTAPIVKRERDSKVKVELATINGTESCASNAAGIIQSLWGTAPRNSSQPPQGLLAVLLYTGSSDALSAPQFGESIRLVCTLVLCVVLAVAVARSLHWLAW